MGEIDVSKTSFEEWKNSNHFYLGEFEKEA
jgi:hypothetical protein